MIFIIIILFPPLRFFSEKNRLFKIGLTWADKKIDFFKTHKKIFDRFFLIKKTYVPLIIIKKSKIKKKLDFAKNEKVKKKSKKVKKKSKYGKKVSAHVSPKCLITK